MGISIFGSMDVCIYTLLLRSRFNLGEETQGIRVRAKFFEKQSQLIKDKIEIKLKEIETYLNNKENTNRLLRIENHSHTKKIRENQRRVIVVDI